MTLRELFLTSVGRCFNSTVIYLNRNVDPSQAFVNVHRKVCIPVYAVTRFIDRESENLISNKINDFT